MQVNYVKKRGAVSAAGQNVPLTFYNLPPTEEISLYEFETFALDRLKLLKGIEAARDRGTKSEELNNKIRAEIKKHGMSMHREADEVFAVNKRRDHISHFILRLAYCQSDDMRRWFLTHECALFRYRLNAVIHDKRVMAEFLRGAGLDYEPIKDEEYNEYKWQLEAMEQINATGNGNMASMEIDPSGVFFKVPFEEALDLVSRRRVFVRAGFAYVPQKSLLNVILARFRAHLSKVLALTYKAMPAREADPRIKNLLMNANKLYVGPNFTKGGIHGKVSLADIEGLAQQSFPMCMRHMHQRLRQDHHLKHGGRMAYGLFLKGIGLSLEDAIAFWRAEFTRGPISLEKFDKEYAYNIRHNYGKEGKRVDYSPYGCSKIIADKPGPGEFHGCPYASMPGDRLKAMLRQSGVETNTATDIVNLTKDRHYQVACLRTFETLHPGVLPDRAHMHPNSWFDESLAYWKAKGGVVPESSQQSSPAKSAVASQKEQVTPVKGGDGTTQSTQATVTPGAATQPPVPMDVEVA